MRWKFARSRGRVAASLISVAVVTGLVLGGCSSTSDSSKSGGADKKISLSLIIKVSSEPFFVKMQEGAQSVADKLGVDLTVAAGKDGSDEDTQIQAIENAVSRGDAGILITSNGPAVEDALIKARKAGLYVIALDTPPTDPAAADITFATDNFQAGQEIGKWTAAKLGGEKAVIAMVDLFDDKLTSVDLGRDQGFLDGMGIDLKDDKVKGDEDKTGTYSGGDYKIVGHQAGAAEDLGRTAAENLLSGNPDINVLYVANEPGAYGAYEAFKAAGKTDGLILVTVDGGCDGVAAVTKKMFSATSQQYPLKMADQGVRAIVKLAETGKKPKTSDGLDFFDTGVKLVTDDPQTGIDSIDSAEGTKLCWG